jgi:hypothetical protein
LLLLATAVTAGTAWVIVECLRAPDIASAPAPSAREPGLRIEYRGLEGARSMASQGKGRSTLTLSAAELSRLIARELAERGTLPPPLVRVGLRPGEPVEIAFTRPLDPLLAESPLSTIVAHAPAGWLTHRVWIDVRVAPHVEKAGPESRRRHLRLELREFALGRQRLPEILARRLVEPDVLRLRWPLPEGVEELTIERDRVLVRVAS